MRKTIALMFTLLFLVSVAFSANILAADDKVTYEFDRINVLYASKFEASAADDNFDDSSYGSWLTDVMGTDKKVTVTYGEIELISDAYSEFPTEERFISVKGVKGSRQFLANSISNDYYQNGKIKKISTTFWSGKTLDGANVVKDYTKDLEVVTYTRNYDEEGNLVSFELYFYELNADKSPKNGNPTKPTYVAEPKKIEIKEKAKKEYMEEKQIKPIEEKNIAAENVGSYKIELAKSEDVKIDASISKKDETKTKLIE